MSETPTIERAITIHRDEDGHYPLTAVVTDAPGSMPIALVGAMPGVPGDARIYMKWSEWVEIRDHIEHCGQMRVDRAAGLADPVK